MEELFYLQFQLNNVCSGSQLALSTQLFTKASNSLLSCSTLAGVGVIKVCQMTFVVVRLKGYGDRRELEEMRSKRQNQVLW